MNGLLLQGIQKIDYRNVSIIRGVIAGEVDRNCGIEPGDAALVIEHRTFPGSVIEINEDEVVFSTPQTRDVAPLLGATPDETVAESSTTDR